MTKILIYAIKESSTGEIVYIGSTKQTLSRRITHHLTYAFVEKYSKSWDRKLYTHIRETCDRKSFYDYFEVEILKTADVGSRTEKLMMEREYIDKYNPRDNDEMPYATDDEKAEQKRKGSKKWYRNNKDKKRELNRRWDKNNSERKRELNRMWREKQKQKSLNLSKS